MAEDRLPLKQGPTAPGSSDVAGEPPAEEKHCHTLNELASDYRFFTPALLVTHGRWDRDPVAEYVHDNPGPGSYIRAIDCVFGPFFQNLGKKAVPLLHKPRKEQLIDWDRRLYAIPKDWMPHFQSWLEGIVVTSPRHNYYFRPLSFDLVILDLPAMHARPVLPESIPSVGIRAFGFCTMTATYLFSTPTPVEQLRGELPEPVKMRPMREAVREGRQLLDLPPLEEAGAGSPTNSELQP